MTSEIKETLWIGKLDNKLKNYGLYIVGENEHFITYKKIATFTNEGVKAFITYYKKSYGNIGLYVSKELVENE